MSKKVSFSMNTGPGGGQDIIQIMVRPAVITAAERIAQRATIIDAAIRGHPHEFRIDSMGIGLPNRYGGERLFAVVKAARPQAGEGYAKDCQALQSAVDAGRMNRLV